VAFATESSLVSLACKLASEERFEDAIVCFGAALEMNPNNTAALGALGRVLQFQGKLEAAEAIFRRALRIEPANAWLHAYLGSLLLLAGRFDECWAELEWQWRTEPLRSAATQVGLPRWDGSSLEGRGILLQAPAGGFGDNIMWARWIPAVAAEAARVVMQCPSELARLLGRSAGVQQVITLDEPAPAGLHVHAPLTSLPYLLARPRPEDSPPPYLAPDPTDVDRWAGILGPRSALRVGVAWATAADHPGAERRSMPLACLEPLMRVPGVSLFSLQKGEAASSELAASGLPIQDLTGELRDFADTAALLAQLDLVVAVDTAVAHLAGALARPLWILLAARPDGRWLLRGEDSPWYPTARLFRQEADWDWPPVVARAAEALEHARGLADLYDT